MTKYETLAAVGAPSGGGLVAALAIVALLGLNIVLTGTARPDREPSAAAAPASFDPSRFLLNALLVPALDADAMPLRWADPVPASFCGPDSEVRVDGEPLIAGSLVSDTPVQLEWRSDGCRPLGLSGPRYDGRVRLTVFRENWGLSAIVEPMGLRVSFNGREATLTQKGGAWLPFTSDGEGAVELTAIGARD